MRRKPVDEKPKGRQPGSAPTYQQNPTASQIAAVNKTLIAIGEQQEKASEEGGRREDKRYRTEILVATGVGIYTLITAGLFIAALKQVGAAKDQVGSANDQIKIMRDTEHRQLRAYLGILGGDLENFGDKDKQTFTFVRKNYGQTPAYDVTWSSQGQAIIQIGQPIPIVEGAPPDISHLISIFPGMEMPFKITTTTAPKDRMLYVTQSDKMYYVYYGTVRYKDTFGESHYTKYCWMFKGKSMSSKDAEGCLGNNDSD
jgi:hypothetical protein